ncbi:retinol dehydrogenase 13-like [Ornithodoros turicata]|uniref:retinol dehydrogenase 13-like n=1 Tax=Ornithodoros turicata TaxID=34597 RepID=UPI003138BD25
MMEGTLSEYVFYMLCPCAFLVGLFSLIKHIIRKTEFFHTEDTLEGKTVVVTGGSGGLGRTLCLELARRGARVVIAGRTRLRRDSTAYFLREKTGSFNVRVMYMDLTNLESIREFAKELIATEERLDVIINNAAILSGRDYTADGIDLMMGVNFVGHFFLTTLLIDKLRSTPGGIRRVINIVCGGFKQGVLAELEDMEDKHVKSEYDHRSVYRSSKLGLYLFNKELARRYRPFDVAALCVDPGPVSSGLYKNLPGFEGRFMSTLARIMFRTTEEGIQSALYAVMARKLENESGKVIKDCSAYDVKNSEWTEEACKSLWDRTEELIRSKGIPFSLEEEEAEEEDLGGEYVTEKVNFQDFAQRMQSASQDKNDSPPPKEESPVKEPAKQETPKPKPPPPAKEEEEEEEYEDDEEEEEEEE